ncbi:MFS transporter [Nocardia sp. NPDC088792]|uniref:MFS transporter n=1 Tax=Nocardia sp. NPDC088792 TaxID=3364332 RepID=UPI003825013C
MTLVTDQPSLASLLTSAPTGIRRTVLWGAAITAFGGLLFGSDTGVISGALLFIGKDFHGLSSANRELLVGILLLGAVVGAVVAGKIADRIGRRRTVLSTALVFIVGVLLAAFCPGYVGLLVARFVIGSASMVVPLYIGECVPPRDRGTLVSCSQLAITFGILASYLVDFGLSSSQNWRLMFGLAVVPALLMFVGMLFRREGPQWPIAQGLLNPKVRYAVGIGIALAAFQQITGIDTVVYYAPTLLSEAGFGQVTALLANVVSGAVNLGLTLIAIRLLDRTGRRPLLLTGTAGMAVGMLVVGVTFLACGSHLHGVGAYVAVGGLLIYTGAFAVGLGPVFWLLIREIYPVMIRGRAMSVATVANWGVNFVVTVSFLTLLGVVGNAGTFFLFGSLTVVALAYVYLRVPESETRCPA